MLNYANELQVRDYSENRVSQFYPLLANLAFFLYMFFAFYGTAMPFREKLGDVEDIATSNIVNQIAFSGVFVLAVIALLPKLKTVLSILFREKILAMFILWGLLSVIWSDYSFVSFKRWFQYFTGFTVIITVMIHVDFSEIMLKRIRYLFYAYLIISFASIMTIPGAKDVYGIWRGIAPSKNHLGQAALISALVIFYSVWTEKGYRKFIPVMMIVLAVVLLVGSQSMTSLLTLIMLACLGTIFFIENSLRSLKLGRMISIILITGSAALFFTMIYLAPDYLSSAAGAAGKDLTFTGRTELWSDLISEVEDHWLLGTGFQGFWVVKNPELLVLYDTYTWLPNQAHNGYLDILNEVGVIGLLLFMAVLINYFRNYIKLDMPHYWKWFTLVAIIINFQESTFIRPQVATGVMFLVSYIALFSDIYRRDENQNFREFPSGRRDLD